MKRARSHTEASSHYAALESRSVRQLLTAINQEDQKVPVAVRRTLPAVGRLIGAVYAQMKGGGRLFYIGAGTSGRLGILDASEIPPTYGMPFGRVVALMAGGDRAIRKAVEHAEDDEHQGWKDLASHRITNRDFLIGIAASGRTPYVVGALRDARAHGIPTGCLTSNRRTPLRQYADYPVEVFVGPEVVTGSTRMKSGTAQKLILNMISTVLMIRLGRVEGNRMVDMRLSNNKLIRRGTQMVMDELGVKEAQAKKLLTRYGSVRKAVAAKRKK